MHIKRFFCFCFAQDPPEHSGIDNNSRKDQARLDHSTPQYKHIETSVFFAVFPLDVLRGNISVRGVKYRMHFFWGQFIFNKVFAYAAVVAATAAYANDAKIWRGVCKTQRAIKLQLI